MTSQELRERTLADESLTEAERVELWVQDQLVKDGGFTLDQALQLVAAKADWHEAVALVSAGCPHQTAVDILG